MNYVIDTNIVLTYLKNGKVKEHIESEYKLFESPQKPIISIVTIAEIRAIALRNNWGQKRIEIVEKFLNELIVVDIRYNDLINAYAEIDVFSQGKLKGKPLMLSSRNMGKNDIWIAATAYVTNSKLVTIDQDFKHLDNQYLELILIEI